MVWNSLSPVFNMEFAFKVETWDKIASLSIDVKNKNQLFKDKSMGKAITVKVQDLPRYVAKEFCLELRDPEVDDIASKQAHGNFGKLHIKLRWWPDQLTEEQRSWIVEDPNKHDPADPAEAMALQGPPKSLLSDSVLSHSESAIIKVMLPLLAVLHERVHAARAARAACLPLPRQALIEEWPDTFSGLPCTLRGHALSIVL